MKEGNLYLSRPRKCRKVCNFPQTLVFVPEGSAVAERPSVIMSVDEYEVIRLIDKEGLTQEQCGMLMQIARTTVQQIYSSARQKHARVLVDGLTLQIAGGDYQLCDGSGMHCSHRACMKRQFQQMYAEAKGETIMRIAVTYENGKIFQHFGHTEQFKVYDVENGQILSSRIVGTNGNGHGALAGILHALNVDTLICGGIGDGAQAALAASGIKLYGGVTGEADKAVEDLIAGNLDFDSDVHCEHHDHAHGEVHTCNEHGCGEHHCN